MAAKQFIDLADLTLFKSLYDAKVAEDIATAEAKSLHTVTITGNTLKFYRAEEPLEQGALPDYSITLPSFDPSTLEAEISDLQDLVGEIPAGATAEDIVGYIQEYANSVGATKTEKEITTAGGKALMFNESDGGGAKFENADGTWSFVGVNDGGASGLTAQIYSVDHNNNNTGSRINVTTGGIYYTSGKTNATYTADDEIATKGDVRASGDAATKTVYITETAGQSGDLYSKRYGIYQGSQGSSASPVVAEKLADIDIPKDMFVEQGTVGTVTTPDVPYEGAQVGDKYIDLVLANAQSTHIYIPANSLVDVYTAQQNATQIQLAIDSNNVISATVVAGSIGTTELANASVTDEKLANSAKALFDAAGAASTVSSNITGTAQDDKDDLTLYGLRAYADDVAGDSTEPVPEEDIRSLFGD